jgi:hypothetical protein
MTTNTTKTTTWARSTSSTMTSTWYTAYSSSTLPEEYLNFGYSESLIHIVVRLAKYYLLFKWLGL